MASPVFFWNMACPVQMCSPKARPMLRPIRNWMKEVSRVSRAMTDSSSAPAPLWTMFFIVMPEVMASETLQQ